MKHFPWNCENIARLERGLAAKEPIRRIAASLGLSDSAVRDKAVKLDLYVTGATPSFWTPEREDTLRTYVAAGMPYKEIGQLLGCGKNAAIGKAGRMGIDGTNPNANPRGPEPTTLLQRLDALDVFPPAGRCVFPHGDPGKPDFHFCSAAAHETGASYCDEHHKLCVPNAVTLANIAAWANDPERHEKQRADARRRGLAKMRGKAA